MPNTTAVTPDHSGEAIYDLAGVIARNWKKPYFGAVPYLEAMYSLEHISDSYGQDRGDMVVRYFLANAGTWRGDVARSVKAELKRRLAA